MGQLEIIIVILSFVALMAAGAIAGKRALAFSKAARQSQERTQAKVEALMVQSEVAQQWAATITHRQAILQRKVEALQVSLAKMAVLGAALADAKRRVEPLLRYLGIWN